MSYRPLVSIVIPVYNGANYLADAIDSALAQTYPNIEVLVVDDGSSDAGATAAVARRYGERIRYIHQPNGGVAAALNRGIEHMRGEFFSWLSHDDIYLPDKVERQIEAYFEFGRRCVVIGDCELVDDDGHSVPRTTKGLNLIAKPLDAVFQGLINGCALLVPRSLFGEVGLFDPGLPTTQDYYLWYRMARKAPFVQCFHVGVRQRIHPLQGSRQASHLDESGRMFIHLLEETPPEIMRGYSGSEARFLLDLRPTMSVYPAALGYVRRRLRELLRGEFRYSAAILTDSHPRVIERATEQVRAFSVPPAEFTLVGPQESGGASLRAAAELAKSEWILVQSARRMFDDEQVTALLEQLVSSGVDIAIPSEADEAAPAHGWMFRRDALAEAVSLIARPGADDVTSNALAYQLKKPARSSRHRLSAALNGADNVHYAEGIDDADVSAAVTEGFVKGRPVFLLLMHTIHGGSQTHVFHFAGALSRHANVLLAYGNQSAVRLSRSPETPNGGIVFDWAESNELARLLHMVRVCRVDVHSAYGFEAQADAFLKTLALPYDLTVLDYDLFARHPHLADSSGRFVGDHQLCGNGGDMVREPHPIARHASRVITLCRDTAARLARIANGLPILAPERWDRPAMTVRQVFVPRIGKGEPLRIVIPGRIDNRKGSDVVVEAAAIASKRKLPICFDVLGELITEPSKIAAAGEALVQHGPYQRADFAVRLSTIHPHLGWVPTQVPETWCYVLSELFGLALPVAATAIGALRERCHGRPATWLLPYNATAEIWIDLFLRLHVSELRLPPIWASIDDLPPACPFYFDGYLDRPYVTRAGRQGG